MREGKKRVPTCGAHEPLAGLGIAFAGLQIPKLPEPEKMLVEAPQQTWKMGRVILRRETAHRGGKTVIVIHDFASHLPLSVIETLGRKVRVACGCGGAVKDRQIEVQGDHPEKIRAVLENEGFQVAGVK